MAMTVRLTPYYEEKLDVLSHALGVTKQDMVEEAVAQYVANKILQKSVRDSIDAYIKKLGTMSNASTT